MVLGDKVIQIELAFKRKNKEFKLFLDKLVTMNILLETFKLRTLILKFS